jgi:formyltetrahydrofolate deformylase
MYGRSMAAETARLLISCPDRPGIVAAVSTFLYEQGANILQSDQYSTDPTGGRFLMRMEFHREGLEAERDRLEEAFEVEVARRFGMEWRIWYAAHRKRVALMVSRQGHCLLDLLWRWRSGELYADVVQVVSNHPDLGRDVEGFGVPYSHVPIEPDGKQAAEQETLRLLRGRCDVLVLARYMQIFSGDFLESIGAPVINIHHSFLPAFAGANPYERAQERGVKIIGATAHYVTEELDAGPIIEQDVVPTSHRATVRELEQRGADIERTVLARAVQWHLQDRVLVHENRTIVF